MLRLCCLALCLALVSSSAIGNKRRIGNAFQDKEQHPAARQREEFILNRRLPVGPSNNTPVSSDCKTKNLNEKCKQATLRGGTFLTNLEGTALGPGFPPKPVGFLVRPNVSREEASSTSAPEGRFLVDDKPPMPPPPLKRRPLPKGSLRRPFLNIAERQGLSQEDIDPIILGPLFYEDARNSESLKKTEEKSQGMFLGNSNGSGERNRALLDSFNELDQPDPKLLSELKGKLYQNPKLLSELKVKFYPKYFGENKNSKHIGKEDLRRSDGEHGEEDKSNENSEEANHYREEEGPISGEEAPARETSEDYESSKEEGPQNNSEEDHSSHHLAEEVSQEEEESVSVTDPDNQENSEEGDNQPKEHLEKEGNQPIKPPSEKGLESPPLIKQGPNGSLENNEQKLTSVREEDGPESEESAEGEEQIPKSGEASHSAEESTEDNDYSEENNNIDSSAPSEEDAYHSSAEEDTSGESNESAQKPASSSEDTNEIQQTSIESSSEESEDYDSSEHSQEQHSGEQESQEQTSEEQHSLEEQSEERPDKSSSEYDDEEQPPDYYYLPDYDNESPESDYEDIFPKPEQEPTRKPQVYQKKRPATFYYIVGGPERENESDNVDNGSKPIDYEDNKIKQSEVDSPTPLAEEHPSSSSDESFGNMGFGSFDLDPVLKKPMVESDDKTRKSPVAVISNTTPQTDSTKCDDSDTKKNEDPEDYKRLKTPSGTANPNNLQPGDVVSITRARPGNFGLRPTAATTTTTFRPATISAIGIVKPGGSIIAKVVSPTLQVLTPTPQAGGSTQVPWKTILAAREATALTYLKPPPVSQQQTWFLSQARPRRFVRRIAKRRPL